MPPCLCHHKACSVNRIVDNVVFPVCHRAPRKPRTELLPFPFVQ